MKTPTLDIGALSEMPPEDQVQLERQDRGRASPREGMRPRPFPNPDLHSYPRRGPKLRSASTSPGGPLHLLGRL